MMNHPYPNAPVENMQQIILIFFGVAAQIGNDH